MITFCVSADVGSQKITALETPESEDSQDGMAGVDFRWKRQGETGSLVSDHGGPLPTHVSTFPFAGAPVMRLDEDGTTGQVRSKKWVNTGARNVLDIGDETLPSFPNDEEVVGIITMEDLIEELLQVRLQSSWPAQEFGDQSRRKEVVVLQWNHALLLSLRYLLFTTL